MIAAFDPLSMIIAAASPLDHVLDHPIIVRDGWFLLTNHMLMIFIAAGLMLAIFPALTRRYRDGELVPTGTRNFFEAIMMYIRNDVVKPVLGGKTDRFIPYLWTLFFFILFCNLLGMIPGGASPTGNINVTAMLALMTLGAVILAGSRELGAVGFWLGIVPHLDVPWWLKPPLWGLMFVIEVAGLLIRHVVLAVRLFANMMAGHIVLAVILGFILVAQGPIAYLVTPASLLGVVTLSLLELFVAFLQAYIFTFLSALFIGSAVHPH